MKKFFFLVLSLMLLIPSAGYCVSISPTTVTNVQGIFYGLYFENVDDGEVYRGYANPKAYWVSVTSSTTVTYGGVIESSGTYTFEISSAGSDVYLFIAR